MTGDSSTPESGESAVNSGRGSSHWKDQDECQDCGRDDVPLRAIKMVNSDRMMLCRDCFKTALEVGEVDPTDPRLDGGVR